MAKKISDKNRIINALDTKGWTDAIAYQTPETFGSKRVIWCVEFEVNHASEDIFDKQLEVSEMHFEGGKYDGEGVIYADTVEIVLEIIAKLPDFK